MELDNPFSGYGSIIPAERFLDRKANLKKINSRVLGKEGGNLAILGEPRIGKSCLVYKAIIERRQELLEKKIIPIWLNIGTYDNVINFFCSLVESSFEELESNFSMTETIKNAFTLVFEQGITFDTCYKRIEKFFEQLKKENYRTVFILDEFDHVRNIFKDNISSFQKLRELSYNPKWRVVFVIMSRRTIKDIEIQSGAISTLDGIFHKEYLGMFNDEGVQEHLDRYSSVGISIDSGQAAKINYYCGGHPFLLDMLGYEVIELYFEGGKIDIEVAGKKVTQSFLDAYDHIIQLLQEDNSLNKLLQIIFGPVIDVKQFDIEKFLKYGLIREGLDNSYVAFSEHFQNYLKLIEREVDLWPIWKDTEKALRKIITTKMLEFNGPQWIEELEKKSTNLKSIIEKCREAQNKEKNSFGVRASENLLDFTYPGDLFAIIFAYWDQLFKPLFNKDKNYWGQRQNLLAKIRNPLAHNRDDILQDFERQTAEGYCKEILTVIRAI